MILNKVLENSESKMEAVQSLAFYLGKIYLIYFLGRGHNGIKSIIQKFDGQMDFKRLLIGIGRPASKESWEVARYVTGNFDQESLDKLDNELFSNIFDFLNQNENLNL